MKTLIQKKESLMQSILKLCEISDFTYSQTVYKTGCEYARKNSINEEMYMALTGSKVFWKFYENQFLLIDKAICYTGIVPDAPELLTYSIEGISKISF